ncbi:hypothetical protein ABE197_17510 [Bacillus subtilis]
MDFSWIIPDIPEKLRPAVLTATTTLIGAFIGACVAQFFSHRLTLKRERKHNQRVIYNELYAPILTEIYLYYDYVTAFRKDLFTKEVNVDKMMNEICDHIGKNLKYASPRIINAYNTLARFDYMEDLSGVGRERSKYELIVEVLNELIKIAPYDKKNIKEISKYRTCYYLLQIFGFIFYEYGKAELFLSYDFNFKRKKLYNDRTYKRLKLYYDIKYPSNWAKKIIKKLFILRYDSFEDYFFSILIPKEHRSTMKYTIQFIKGEIQDEGKALPGYN